MNEGSFTVVDGFTVGEEALPEGWEPIAFRHPKEGEHYVTCISPMLVLKATKEDAEGPQVARLIVEKKEPVFNPEQAWQYVGLPVVLRKNKMHVHLITEWSLSRQLFTIGNDLYFVEPEELFSKFVHASGDEIDNWGV